MLDFTITCLATKSVPGQTPPRYTQPNITMPDPTLPYIAKKSVPHSAKLYPASPDLTTKSVPCRAKPNLA